MLEVVTDHGLKTSQVSHDDLRWRNLWIHYKFCFCLRFFVDDFSRMEW
jgi:hypothetical protein